MGDGLVVEQGTHQELLHREGGAYARLVQAQRLRESDEVTAVTAGDDIDDEDDAPKDMEKAAREEVPLGRRNTGQSLASQILEQKKKEQKGDKEPDHSMYYLFKRMGIINRSQWKKYFLGTIFATMTGMVYPAFGVVYGALSSFLSSRTVFTDDMF